MEQSRQELLEAADRLEADAVAHERNARFGAAAESRDQAERLRAQADGAPVGPAPDAVEAAVASVREKLAGAREQIRAGIETYLACEDALVDLFTVFGSGTTPAADAPAAESDDERAAAIDAAVADALIAERGFDIEASVPELIDYVGDDVAKAAAVLKVEGEDGRSTLVEPLTKLVEAQAATDAPQPDSAS